MEQLVSSSQGCIIAIASVPNYELERPYQASVLRIQEYTELLDKKHDSYIT